MRRHPDIPLALLPPAPRLEDFDKIFAALHGKVSDLYLQPEKPVCARYMGRVIQVTEKAIGTTTMSDLIAEMTSTTRRGEILKGEPQSWSHRIQIRNSDDVREILRFRVNAKSVQTLYSYDALSMAMRPTSTFPIQLNSLNLPKKLVENLFPDEGLVLFSGPTGSGKTTTLAAVMNELAYDERGLVIVTIEDPVEVNLHVLPDPNAWITHCELERNVKSFALAMKAVLRENPDVIMTGEMRDEFSMRIAVEAGQTGHKVYSTLHANSVTTVFMRVAQKFPPSIQVTILAGFIEASRTFVYQRLFTGVDGNMVPVIEYVVLTPKDRIDLLTALSTGGPAAVTRKMVEVLARSGESYTASALRAFEAGLLNRDDFYGIVHAHDLEVEAEVASAGREAGFDR